MFWHAATSAAAHSGGSVMDRNVPPGTPIRECAAMSAPPQAVVAAAQLGGAARWCSPPAPAAAAPGKGPATRSACSRIDAVQRAPLPDEPARQPAARVGQVLGRLAGADVELDGPVPGQQRRHHGRHPLLALGRLVPGGVLGAVHVQGADVVQLAGLPARRPEPAAAADAGTAPAPGPRRRPRHSSRHSVWHELPRSDRPARSRAASARRTGTGPGSSARPCGTGTAGTPRTRSRPPPGGRGPGGRR